MVLLIWKQYIRQLATGRYFRKTRIHDRSNHHIGLRKKAQKNLSFKWYDPLQLLSFLFIEKMVRGHCFVQYQPIDLSFSAQRDHVQFLNTHCGAYKYNEFLNIEDDLFGWKRTGLWTRKLNFLDLYEKRNKKVNLQN